MQPAQHCHDADDDPLVVAIMMMTRIQNDVQGLVGDGKENEDGKDTMVREPGPGCDEYKFSIGMNIQIYLYPKNDTNEYPNIFVSKK